MFIKPEIYDLILPNLDMLEGYSRDEDEADYDHYLRVKRTARYTDKAGNTQTAECWVYHGGKDALNRMTEANRVPDGDWLAARNYAWR